jgi:hypothetical protein
VLAAGRLPNEGVEIDASQMTPSGRHIGRQQAMPTAAVKKMSGEVA